MARNRYELERAVDDYDEGDVLEVTARYGDWHVSDLRLEPVEAGKRSSIELTIEELKSVTTPANDWAKTTPVHT